MDLWNIHGARYYDPVLGRFITPDTIVQDPYDPQSLNRYAYCRNNPVKYIDPSGHEFVAAITAYTAYLMSNPAEFKMDVDSLTISSAKFLEDKNFSNAVDVILDAAGLGAGPLISGMALKTTKKFAIEGIQSLNKVDNVVDAAKVAKKADKAKDFAYYMKKAETLDIKTSANKAVFYSGHGNKELAEAFAKKTGKTTLEMTSGGKWLEGEKLYDILTKDEAKTVWGRLSQRYAEAASGGVTIFKKGAPSSGIFNLIEDPALMRNPDVYKYLYKEW